MSKQIDLGEATAYAIAKKHGYVGTEAQFAAEMTGAAQSAREAAQDASDAEAYAIGKRDGTDVPSTDPAYHNNAKYWSQQAPSVTSIAPAYSASSTYAVGDYVTYNNKLYECTTAITTAEAWNSSHWTETSVSSEVSDLKGDLNKHTFEILPSDYNNRVANLAGQNIITVIRLNDEWEDAPVTGMLTNTQYSPNYDIQIIYDTSRTGNTVAYRTVNRNTKEPFSEWKMIGSSGGLTEEAESALLECFSNVAWVSANGRNLYNNLRIALGYNVQYPAISVKYEPGYHIVRAGDNVNSLKDYVTVTYFPDSISQSIIVPSDDYTLSGTIIKGSNVVTIQYEGLTDSIIVVGVQNNIPDEYTPYDYIGLKTLDELQNVPTFQEILADYKCRFNKSVSLNDAYIKTKEYNDLWAPNYEILQRQHTIHENATNSQYHISIGGRSSENKVFGLYNRVNGLLLSVQTKNQNHSIVYPAISTDIQKVIIKSNENNKTTIVSTRGLSVTYDWGDLSIASNGYLYYFDNPGVASTYQTAISTSMDVGKVTIKNPNTLDIIDEYVPVMRKSDGVIGLYDTVDGTFYTSGDIRYATMDSNYCIYKVANW